MKRTSIVLALALGLVFSVGCTTKMSPQHQIVLQLGLQLMRV